MEQSTFQIEIITPLHTYQWVVEWVEIESPTGSFFVGPGHSTLVSLIKNKGTLTYKLPETDPASIVTSQGIFYVSNNKAIAILDQ